MVPVSPWNDFLIDELRRLWAEGYSCGQIADELQAGISRNAVIGKINRLGLARRQAPQPRKPREKTVKRGRPVLQRRPVLLPPLPEPEPPPPDPPPPEKPAEAPRMRKLQLLLLREHHCRWPIGEPGSHPFYFCAADRRQGETYCPFHKEKAFQHRRTP